MRILFMGTPDFAVPILKSLYETYPIAAVVTQPDRPKGRGQGLVFSPVKEAALALGKYGITVNTLSPGSTQIPPRESKRTVSQSACRQDLEFNNYPPGGFLSGRVGYPKDMAYYIVFLADEQSQYITGSTIRADGGAMMN